MTRDEAIELLDDYLQGELADTQLEELEAMLSRDPQLVGELAQLQSLLQRAEQLVKDIQPKRDLWPHIEQRICEQSVVAVDFASRATCAPPTLTVRTERSRWLLAAAAACVIFAFGIGLGVVLNPFEAEQTEEKIAAVQPASAEQLQTAATLQRIDTHFAVAEDELLALMEQRWQDIDPHSVAVIRENLRLIDQSITTIRGELECQPDNPELNRLLVMSYRKRSELLRKTAELADSRADTH